MQLTGRAVALRAAVFLGLTWLGLAVLGGAQSLAPGIPAGVVLPQLAPGLAALVMLVIFRRDGLHVTFSLGSRPVARVAVAVLVPLTLAYAVVAVLGVGLSWSVPLAALVWIPIGAIGEELGWRAYLNRVLDARLRGLSSAVIVGLVWLPFHVGMWGLGMPRLALFGVTLVAASIVLFALVHDAGFSLTLAALFHCSYNVGAALLGDAVTSLPVMAVSAVAWTLAAAAAVVMRRGAFLSVAARR